MKYIFFGLFSMSLIVTSCRNESGITANTATDPLDISAQDSAVKPQNNFFLFANGDWLKTAVIPPSQSSWGAFSSLQDSSLVRIYRILDSLTLVKDAPNGSIAQQTGDFFISAMDSAGIEQKRWEPLRGELDAIAAVKDKPGIYDEVAKEYQINHAPFFAFYVTADDRDSRMNIAHFDQGGLGLPSRDYYFKNDSSTKTIRETYLAYMNQVFILLGDAPAVAAQKAQSVLDLETAMAAISKTPVALRDPISNYNKIVVGSKPGLKDLLVKFGVQADTILVGQPAYYSGLRTLIVQTPLETLKNYLRFHVVNDDADYLSKDFVDAKFAFNKLLTGQSARKERWKQMSTLVGEQLGDNLGHIYVDKYFTAADKKRISELVDNIVATYDEKIRQLDWMSDSTKQKALVKLHAIVKKIGYPDKWKDYSSIKITRDDVIANLRGTANYAFKQSLAKIGKPVDRNEWFMTAQTVNAYYEPTQNNINFPAGILQPPFYYSSGDDAVNYGGIGLVIGHEISHGFDDQGRQYDADGNLKNWWSPEDAKKFTDRARNIINQYSGYITVDTVHLNGQLTEGENIADNAGLAVAYAAFKKTAQGKANEKIGGFTADQRFFLSEAQIWRTKTRPERLRTLALTNPHSAPMWRVNGPVSNMPAFYAAFDVQPTDSMYRSDSLRVKIW